MPGRGEEAGRFFETRFAAEIGRVICRDCRISLHPLRVLAAEVASVKLVIAVHPTADILAKLSKIFGCDPSLFFADENHHDDKNTDAA